MSEQINSDVNGRYGHECRQLTEEEMSKLSDNSSIVSQFRQNKLELEAKKNWDLFYKRNTTKFFKDRHWTQREFQELIGSDYKPIADNSEVKRDVLLLEVGCGVGNTIWPLIEENTSFRIYVCDFSPVAIDLLQKNPLFDRKKCTPFVADITEEDGIRKHLGPDIRFDLISLIFVLSAINPNKMKNALKSINQVLRPNGLLLFRDYGLYDHAMLRFSSGHKLSDHFYVRQDGTRAFYFSLEHMESLVTSCGFKVIRNNYINRQTVNRKEGISAERVFIQGKYEKTNDFIETDKNITE